MPLSELCGKPVDEPSSVLPRYPIFAAVAAMVATGMLHRLMLARRAR